MMSPLLADLRAVQCGRDPLILLAALLLVRSGS
jgi:hypothetical protein